MTLIEVIERLETLDPESTVYALEPWTEGSPVLIAPEPEEGGLPAEARDLGLKYFLEVFLIQEILEDWMANLGEMPSSKEKCARIIQYAITDA